MEGDESSGAPRDYAMSDAAALRVTADTDLASFAIKGWNIPIL
jgi:hypothetical protein